MISAQRGRDKWLFVFSIDEYVYAQMGGHCASYIFRFLTTKEKFHEFVDSEWQSLNGGDSTKDEKSVDTNVEEPDAKKAKLDHEDRKKDRKSDGKRLRGQNKSRPHTKPTTYEEKRLCLSVIQV